MRTENIGLGDLQIRWHSFYREDVFWELNLGHGAELSFFRDSIRHVGKPLTDIQAQQLASIIRKIDLFSIAGSDFIENISTTITLPVFNFKIQVRSFHFLIEICWSNNSGLPEDLKGQIAILTEEIESMLPEANSFLPNVIYM